jgi:hypothetical protein
MENLRAILRSLVGAGPAPTAITHEALLKEVISSFAAGNMQRFHQLLDANAEQVKSAFPAWTTPVPEQIMKDPVQLKQFGGAMVAMIQYFDAKGDSSLARMIESKDPTNAVSNWGQNLDQAQLLLDSSPRQTIKILEPYAVQFKGGQGTAADKYMPRTLGVLGVAYFKLGNPPRALAYLEQAKSYCERIGDQEGIDAYSANIDHVRGD